MLYNILFWWFALIIFDFKWKVNEDSFLKQMSLDEHFGSIQSTSEKKLEQYKLMIPTVTIYNVVLLGDFCINCTYLKI